jgi:hypothetical protein
MELAGTAALEAVCVKSLAELIDVARVELYLVWTEPTAAVFREILPAAKQQWSRLGEKGDEALLAAHHLMRVVPGYMQRLDPDDPEYDPEYDWLAAVRKEIAGREDKFDERLPKRRGRPKQSDIRPALFAALRTDLGHSYDEAVRAITSLCGIKPKTVEKAIERSEMRVGRIRMPCKCREPFPYCETHRLWLSPDTGLHQLHARDSSGCVVVPRAIERTKLVCPAHGERLVQYRVPPGDVRSRCPSCGGRAAKVVSDPWPHAHCAVCNRPHPVRGLGPSLFQISETLWACGYPADPASCLRRVLKMRDDSSGLAFPSHRHASAMPRSQGERT